MVLALLIPRLLGPFLLDSAFDGVHGLSGAEAKQRLLKMFAAQRVDAKVTLTFVIVSLDLHHDPAFVQHVNDTIITPCWFTANADAGVKWTAHFADSDGAPNQFNLADQYLWISCQQGLHGIHLIWTINCPCQRQGEGGPRAGCRKEPGAGGAASRN